MDALCAIHHYKLQDEQDKYFVLIKGILGADRQFTSIESGRIGRSFFLFCAQIMGSYNRGTKFAEHLRSMTDILNDM